MRGMKRMSSTRDFFMDDPWGSIDRPCYPEGRRLYLQDERFYVSMNGDRQLLLFVQDIGGEAIKPLENLAGLTVDIERHMNNEFRLVCSLTTTEAELEEKFATVAKDIAFHCSGYRGAQLFLKTQERIKSWANFLKPSRSGLSPSEFIGFFGELYVLCEHLIPVAGAEDSVKAWIGPEGKKQDFTLDDLAIEVKTTVSGDQQAIKITSLDQLEKVTSKLYLTRVVTSPATLGEGLSLRDLYERCLQETHHDVALEGLFLQRATPLYGKASESQVNDQFKVVNLSVFDVVDEFPKLTRGNGNVNPSIREAKYEISLEGIASFELKSDLGEILKHG